MEGLVPKKPGNASGSQPVDGDDPEVQEYDSDATTCSLGHVSPRRTPRGEPANEESPSGASTTSVETVYEPDPDYPGVIPQSQPCIKNGVHYTPLGLKRTYQRKDKGCKRRKLDFPYLDL